MLSQFWIFLLMVGRGKILSAGKKGEKKSIKVLHIKMLNRDAILILTGRRRNSSFLPIQNSLN